VLSVVLLHQSRIPRELLAALKKRLPAIPPAAPAIPAIPATAVSLEQLFAKGDVLKVHVEATTLSTRPMQISMLPIRAAAEEGMDGLEGELGDGHSSSGAGSDESTGDAALDKLLEREFKSFEEDVGDDLAQEEVKAAYNAESLLVWWKGAPYIPASQGNVAASDQPASYPGEVDRDEDVIFMAESPGMVEGAWRRLFELDYRQDNEDTSSKEQEVEERELADEIGELDGMEQDMMDSAGFGIDCGDLTSHRVGSFFSLQSMPAEWRNELDYLHESESMSTALNQKLRSGKRADAMEFDALMRELEQVEQSGDSRGRSRNAQVAPADAASVIAPAAHPVDAGEA
jgi:hypothetical protein